MDDEYTDVIPADGRGALLQRIFIGFYVVAAVVALSRFFTRALVIKRFGSDDWLMVVGFLLGTAQTVMILLQVRAGLGAHRADLSAASARQSLMYDWIVYIIYFSALCAIKLSILSLYNRIIPNQKSAYSRRARTFIWASAIFIILSSIASVVGQITKCIPISSGWDIGDHHTGQCFNYFLFVLIIAAINVVTDLALFIFPFHLFAVLQLRRAQKIQLFIVLIIGLIPLAASVVHLAVLAILYKNVSLGALLADITFQTAVILLWCQIEVCIGILAASLPSLNALWATVVNKIRPRSSTFDMSYGRSYGSARPSGIPQRSPSQTRIVSETDSCAAYSADDTLVDRPDSVLTRSEKWAMKDSYQLHDVGRAV